MATLVCETVGHLRQYLRIEDFQAKDVPQVAETEVFFAFLELGGDAQRPEAFDWTGKSSELISLSRKRLRRALAGHGSIAEDHRRRNAVRKSGPTCYLWDIWKAYEVDLAHHVDPFRETPQETEFMRRALMELPEVLSRELSIRDLELLKAHYLEGRKQVELAQVQHPELARDRAENTVNVALWRARRRARKALSEQWAVVAQESAA